MTTFPRGLVDGTSPATALDNLESSTSPTAWGAIFVGAVTATALSLALFSLGAGVGLVSFSPWSQNISATTFGVLAGAWLIATQLFTSATGGYLAGRLRTKWVTTHDHEVYFRDTAHGFTVWALAAILTVGFVASGISSAVSGAAHLAGAAATTAADAASKIAGSSDDRGYFTGMLFRTDRPASGGEGQGSSIAEATQILAHDAVAGEVPPADKAYIAQLVAAHTGLSAADAQKRVDDVLAQAQAARDQAEAKLKTAADAARKTGVYVSLWTFIALLAGAFTASYMATVGGRSRDHMSPTG